MAGGKFDAIEREHRETWEKFVRGSTWMTAFVIAILVLMALFLL